MTDKWTLQYTESSFSLTGLLIFIGMVLVIIGVFIAVAYGFNLHNGHTYEENMTNITDTIRFGDNWGCGFITNMTTLKDIRDCFRD